jgi:hypothetical protein
MLKLIIVTSTLRAAAVPVRPGAGSPMRLPRIVTESAVTPGINSLASRQLYAIWLNRHTRDQEKIKPQLKNIL